MNTGKAHPDDILVVGRLSEASMWPEFDRRQVYSAFMVDKGLRGRGFRRAYLTSPAIREMNSKAIATLDMARAKSGGEIVDAVFWRPEPAPTKWQRVRKALLDLCERFG